MVTTLVATALVIDSIGYGYPEVNLFTAIQRFTESAEENGMDLESYAEYTICEAAELHMRNPEGYDFGTYNSFLVKYWDKQWI